jgi:hypothetical protein
MIEQPTLDDIKKFAARKEILDCPNLAVLRVRTWLRAIVRHASKIQSDRDKAVDGTRRSPDDPAPIRLPHRSCRPHVADSFRWKGVAECLVDAPESVAHIDIVRDRWLARL